MDRRELIRLREDIEDVERTLRRHHHWISGPEGKTPAGRVRSSVAATAWQAFEGHVAGPPRRDVGVLRTGIDRGTGITARTADGRTVAVRCGNRAATAT